MSTTHIFGVQAFGCNAQVATTCADACATLERYLFPSFPKMIGAIDRPDVSIRIDQVADQYQISVDDTTVASSDRAIGLVPYLVRAIDDAVIPSLRTLRAVHAGAVLLRGRVLLLPGATHAGKSSLVAELLRGGAAYFSDEYALIDVDGRVHPYPRPLLMRNGSPEQFPVLADEYNASVGNAPAPVGWIFSLEYRPDSGWCVEAVPQSEALLNLLKNTPHVLADRPDMVGVFQRAVAGATCYAGHRSEVAHAADQILQLVDSVS